MTLSGILIYMKTPEEMPATKHDLETAVRGILAELVNGARNVTLSQEDYYKLMSSGVVFSYPQFTSNLEVVATVSKQDYEKVKLFCK